MRRGDRLAFNKQDHFSMTQIVGRANTGCLSDSVNVCRGLGGLVLR